MRWRRVLGLAAGLFAAAPLAAHATANCEWTGYLGNDYAVCTFDPAKDNIRLYNADATGKA